jgi:integrase
VARRKRGEIAGGRDPAGERARAKATPTLAVFAKRYLSEHAGLKKKASSRALDERNLNNHILPALGRLRVDEVGRADLARLHARMRATPIAANRCRGLLCKMFNLAEAWGLRPDGSNPTRHVQKYPEGKRARFLSDAELAGLGSALATAAAAGEHPSVIAAIRLLVFTGCRRDEILKLKWDHIDFDDRCLRLPDSKTGAKRVPLGPPALELLASLERIDGNPYALPGAVKGQHYVALEKAWRRLRARAGLHDLRLHDLRHSFASVGAGLGESLVVIGAMLGHSSEAMTTQYAHLSDDPVTAAADRISGHIKALMTGQSGEVIPIDSGRT